MSAKSPDKGPFGAFLRQAREQAGLAKADLATKVGVCYATIGQWERGAQLPTDHLRARVRLLSEALGIPEAVLFSSIEESSIARGPIRNKGNGAVYLQSAHTPEAELRRDQRRYETDVRLKFLEGKYRCIDCDKPVWRGSTRCQPCHHLSQRREVCKWGHTMTPENVYITPGGERYCLACMREREEERKWLRRLKA